MSSRYFVESGKARFDQRRKAAFGVQNSALDRLLAARFELAWRHSARHDRNQQSTVVQDKGAYFAVSLNNRPQLAVVYHATAVAGFVAANKLL